MDEKDLREEKLLNWLDIFEAESGYRMSPVYLVTGRLKKIVKEHFRPKIVTMTEIENAVGDTSDEYTEGVVELFESKGFEVEG